MYSSEMAPSSHLATVTMRAPFSNSPIKQVQSLEPNLIGCEVIFGGVPPPVCSTYAFRVAHFSNAKGSVLEER